MSTLLIVIHVVVAVFLILVVLLQTGKGAAMGSAFGGGASQTMFGSAGAGNFLSKLTTGAAIVFMITSLTLATVSTRQKSESVIPEEEKALPAETDASKSNEPEKSE